MAVDINQNNIYGDNNFFVSSPKRHLTQVLAEQLQDILDKSEPVKIIAAMGDAEAYDFANEIKKHLDGKGYKVIGVHTAMTMPPMKGQSISPQLVKGFKEIRIGHNS